MVDCGLLCELIEMENENKPRRVRMKESGTCATVKPNSFSLKKRQQCYVILHLHLPSLHSYNSHFTYQYIYSIRYNVTYLESKVLRTNNVTLQWGGGWVIDIFRITQFKLVKLLEERAIHVCMFHISAIPFSLNTSILFGSQPPRAILRITFIALGGWHWHLLYYCSISK